MTTVWRMTRSVGLLAAIGIGCSGSLSIAQQALAAPGCRPWVNSDGGHANSETPELGCTNRRNLEHMLDDPHDLEHGRELGPADAARESMAIQNYEAGKVKETGAGAAAPGALLIPTTTPQGNAQ